MRQYKIIAEKFNRPKRDEKGAQTGISVGRLLNQVLKISLIMITCDDVSNNRLSTQAIICNNPRKKLIKNPWLTIFIK